MIDPDERTVICGKTGSGKTVFAGWLFSNVGALAIYYNTQWEVRIEQKGDAIIEDLNGFRRAFNKGYRKIVWNPNEDKDIATSELESLINTLFDMGRQINREVKDTPKPFCYLFIDEYQTYSSKKKQNPNIDKVWTMGRRWGILGVAISQRPAEVSHTVLTQSPQHIIFFLGKYEKGYFDNYDIPIFKNDEYADWISRGWGRGEDKRNRYYFLVYDQVELEKYPPVEL